MKPKVLRQSDDYAKKARWAARRQIFAVVFLAAIARRKRVAPHIAIQLIAGAGHDLTLVQADT